MSDPVAPAWRALRRSAAMRGVEARLVAATAVPWWSATFTGHRLTLTLAVDRARAADAWLAGVTEADLPIPDRLVADCAVDRVAADADETRVTVSLLILDAV